MPVFKYVGFMLTYEQAAIISSNILKKDLSDTSKLSNISQITSAICSVLMKRFPDCEVWPMSWPRDSPKEEDCRLLIACHAYDHPHETREHYTEIPCTKRDVKMLAWLKRNGMDPHEMLKQWMTIPNPQDDDPNSYLIRDDDDY